MADQIEEYAQTNFEALEGPLDIRVPFPDPCERARSFIEFVFGTEPPRTTAEILRLLKPDFWAGKWQMALTSSFIDEREVLRWTAIEIESMAQVIDALFWNGSIWAKARDLGWTITIDAQTDQRGVDIGMERRNFPIGLIEAHRENKTIKLKFQTAPQYYPTYPYMCDGVRVTNRREHLIRVIAHELVHVVRVMTCPTGGMYDANFTALNRWVYGLNDHWDRAIPNAVQVYDVDADDEYVVDDDE